IEFPQKAPDCRDAATLPVPPIPAELLGIIHERQPEVDYVGDTYWRRLSLLAASKLGGAESLPARGADATVLDLLNQFARGQRTPHAIVLRGSPRVRLALAGAAAALPGR